MTPKELKERITIGQAFELIDALPKCEGYDPPHGGCGHIATVEESGGMGDDFNRLYWCDKHAEESKRCGDQSSTEWAAIVRSFGDG